MGLLNYVIMGLVLLLMLKFAEFFGTKKTEIMMTLRILTTYKVNNITVIDKYRTRINYVKDPETRKLLNMYLDRCMIFNYSLDIPIAQTLRNRYPKMSFRDLLYTLDVLVSEFETNEHIGEENIHDDLKELIEGMDNNLTSIMETWKKEIEKFEKEENVTC
jgi:hypothetical protein